MASSLVESLSADFEPGKYHDQYRTQVLDLIERKAAGEELDMPAPAAAMPAVVDLMAALEASVAAAKAARTRHPAAHDPVAPVVAVPVAMPGETGPVAVPRRRKSA
jgi:DNA end-binding protein Ku